MNQYIKLLSSKSIFGLVFGAISSRLATLALSAAMAVHILNLTGNAVDLGLTLLMGTIPFFLLSLITGVVCDHFDRKKIILLCDGIRALISGIFLILCFVLNNQITIHWIYAFVFFFSMCEAFVATSFSTIIPDVVESNNIVDVNNLMNGLLETFKLIGPMIGILIYSSFGFEFTLFFTTILFFVSIIVEKNMTYNRIKNPKKVLKLIPKAVSELKIFVGLFKDDYRLTSLFFNGFTTHLFLFPFILIGLPFTVIQVFNGTPLEYGILESVCAAGGLSAVLIVPFTKPIGISKNLLLFMIAMLISAAIFGLVTIAPIAELMVENSVIRMLIFSSACFGIFLSFGVYGVYFVSFLHHNIKSDILGKGMSLVMMFNALGRIIGFLLFGFLFEYSLNIAIMTFILGMSIKLLIHIPFLIIDRYRGSVNSQ